MATNEGHMDIFESHVGIVDNIRFNDVEVTQVVAEVATNEGQSILFGSNAEVGFNEGYGDIEVTQGVQVFDVSPSKTKYWIPVCDLDVKPKVGHYYNTIEECIDAYTKYASYCGFIPRHSCHKKKHGVTTIKWMICSREGGKNGSNSKGLRNTLSDRCWCKAKIVFTRQKDGRYLVKDFVEEHTHPMLSELGSQFSKTNFVFTEEHQKFLLDCSHAQIGPSSAFKLYEQMKGGPSTSSSNVKQFLNFRRDLLAQMKGADAQMVINRLTTKKEVCSGFYFNYTVDSEGCLLRLFWADPEMRVNFATFGENVAFDATYKTNRYHLVFAPFTGVDNHNKCVTFAAGLLVNENADSFEWMFDNFKKAMGHEPKVLVTDQDPAMIVAFKRVFETTRHRFCFWHITSKIPEKVGHVLSNCDDFNEKLNYIVRNFEIEDYEVEERWQSLMQEYQLTNNKWLRSIFDDRTSWIPTYFKGELLNGLVHTTSISESQNNFFKHYVDQRSTLVEFMMHFDSALDKQRFEQKKLNAKGEKNLPNTSKLSTIERYCAEIFTLYAFDEIKKEIDIGCRVIHVEDFPNKVVFTMKSLGDNKDKMFKVEFEPAINHLVCNCSKFNRDGIPYRHAFKVLNDMKVVKMPENLILSRWTKAATLSPTYSIGNDIVEQCEQIGRRKVRLNALRSDFNACLSMIENDNTRIEEFAAVIKEYRLSIGNGVGDGTKRSTKRSLIEEFVGTNVPDVISVNVPKKAKNKGSGKRLKGGKEKAVDKSKKASRRCSVCKKYAAHNSRTCLRLQADKKQRKKLLKRIRREEEEDEEEEEEKEDDDDDDNDDDDDDDDEDACTDEDED